MDTCRPSNWSLGSPMRAIPRLGVHDVSPAEALGRGRPPEDPARIAHVCHARSDRTSGDSVEPAVEPGHHVPAHVDPSSVSPPVMGWAVHEHEVATHAATLIQRICTERGVDPRRLVLHSDNNPPMRGRTMVATLQWLGIVPSFGRPHVCHDNPYSEASFARSNTRRRTRACSSLIVRLQVAGSLVSSHDGHLPVFGFRTPRHRRLKRPFRPYMSSAATGLPSPPHACRSAIFRIAMIMAAVPSVFTSVGCAAYSKLILSTMPASCCSAC